MTMFTIESTTPLQLASTAPLNEMYLLSPFVWREEDVFHILMRAVNHAADPTQKVARVYHGQGDDGLHFVMDTQPALAPGPALDDSDGCEDPSVIRTDGHYYVFYTGWHQWSKTGHLLQATGAHIEHLQKIGRVWPDNEHYPNPKEAELVPCPTGGWRLFFEYASGGHSQLGLASAETLAGPWQFLADPFYPRPGSFDAWHLSPGPVIRQPNGQLIMFYNGATHDAKWRIGWVTLDQSLTKVTARGKDPLVVPPPVQGDATDIAFAASAVMSNDTVWLYYTVSDAQPMRAVLHPVQGKRKLSLRFWRW
jgi:predicted GH43/DUF377 family glycosyl hydrolase